ncbi:MAG: hypothetical protein RJB15_996 [Pseudomonadota bacterium]
MVKIGNIELGSFPLLLAPMEDVSDPPFRAVCKANGADLMYTEFISSEGLIRDAAKSVQKLDIFEYERPIGIQLFGSSIETMAACAEIATKAGPDLIDINYGCPVKQVACKGAGAALLQDIPKMVAMTKAVVDATHLPVTVKTRLGWDDSTKNIEDVAERLREQIFAHELAPGSWLDEQSLAIAFGISRTPMREAIKVLASEGLVTIKMRRGAYVTEIARNDLEQIFTILSLLEGEAAKQTAMKATEEELNQLDYWHHRLEKAAADRDIEQFFEINGKFHELIQDIAGNRWMNGVIADLRKVLKLHRRDSLTSTGRLQNSLIEHREILKAILKRDLTGAETAMRKHMERGLEALR